MTNPESTSAAQNSFLNTQAGKSRVLLWAQITLCVSLVLILALVLSVNEDSRELLYVLIVACLLLALILALGLNIAGQYRRSAIITLIATVIGPWCAIFLDPTVFQGDLLPLVYISLSIQLCALLLSTLPTAIIASVQFTILLLCIFFNPELMDSNWPSLITFVVLASAVSLVTSFINRRQFKEIEAQRARLEQDEVYLREAATRDSLTGLYNRRYMVEALKKEISRASRSHSSLGVMMIDIDKFKTLNDGSGHVYGDFAIAKVAKVLSDNTRDFDTVCRYGGDEFVLVLPDSALSDTLKRAENMRRIVENTNFTFDRKMSRVTISVGVSTYPEFGVTGEGLLRSADKALYMAKESGRNAVFSAQSLP